MNESDRDVLRIKNNILCLKEIRGDTWENIANSLGYENGSAISNYFSKGRGLPNDELLTKIANYFGVTLQDLRTGDFSYNYEDLNNDDTISHDELAEFFIHAFESQFPTVCTDEAMEDVNFINAYELHKSILCGDIININDIIKAFNLYLKAYKNGSVEASFNALSLVAVRWTILMIDVVANAYDITAKEEYNYLDIMNNMSLVFRAMETDYGTQSRNAFFDNYNSAITKLMENVQNSNKYYQYAYYFLAMRYFMGMLDSRLTNYSFDQERAFGLQLIEYLSYIGNQYAKNALSIFEKN